MGGLLFNFDPCFCGGGVELEQTVPDWWPYHYSHAVLMVVQLVALVVVLKAEKVVEVRRD